MNKTFEKIALGVSASLIFIFACVIAYAFFHPPASQLGIGTTTVTGADSQTAIAASSTNITTTDFQTVEGTVLDDLIVGGEVYSTSVRRSMTQALVFSASTQTLAIFNLPANAQFLTNSYCGIATTTNTGGNVRITLSMGTGYATGTTVGVDKFYDSLFDLSSVAAASPYLTSSSTLPGVASSTAGQAFGNGGDPLLIPTRYGPVYRATNKILIVKQAYNTSTATGFCTVEYVTGSRIGN